MLSKLSVTENAFAQEIETMYIIIEKQSELH